MIVSIKLFALARQLAQREEIEIELPEDATIAQLRQALVKKLPGLSDLANRLAFAINSQYATNETIIHPNTEIACIPPVSGG